MQKNKSYLTIIIVLTLIVSGCVQKTQSNSQGTTKADAKVTSQSKNASPPPEPFTGIKGETVVFSDNSIAISENSLEDGLAHYYNTTIDGKTVYFFAVKDKNGVYRAAANACQVCHSASMGFRQEGDSMVCNTCGNAYPLEKIATEKGGCNPIPISPNLSQKDGNIIINFADFSEAAKFF